MPEKPIQKKIFKNLGGRRDVRLFRNNIGVAKYKDKTGKIRHVKFGVCNPGGSDLIGWRIKTITPEMVGRRVAMFLAIETKAPKKGPNKNQRTFINQVNAAGGLAGVARDVDQASNIVDFK